jgi:hypothetical protein
LADTNEKWKKQNEEIDGISQELAGLGWAAMDGDSDFEEEEADLADRRMLQYQLWAEQEGHFQGLGQRRVKGQGKGVWMEGAQEEEAGGNQPAEDMEWEPPQLNFDPEDY